MEHQDDRERSSRSTVLHGTYRVEGSTHCIPAPAWLPRGLAEVDALRLTFTRLM